MKQTIERREGPLSKAEKLRLAAETFEDYYTECFWYLRKDLRVGPEEVLFSNHSSFQRRKIP
jgi:hypothetical protein